MRATITEVAQTSECIMVRVRRNCRDEKLDNRSLGYAAFATLHVGDKVNVKRTTNNPYLVFVSVVSTHDHHVLADLSPTKGVNR